MPVRSSLLGRLTPATAGEVVLYTCPAGFRTIVKDVRIVSVAVAPGAMFVQTRTGGTSPSVPILYVPNGVSAQLYVAEGAFVVMNAGDTLTASVASVTGGVWAVQASGAELAL